MDFKIFIKPLLPTIKKTLGSGEIDKALQSFKNSYYDHLESENDTIVIVNSTEVMPDGTKKEFLNICKMDENMSLSQPIEQFPLNEAITKLLKENL